MSDLQQRLAELQQQSAMQQLEIMRLREVLKYYANENEWSGYPWKLLFNSRYVDDDGYAVAKRTLSTPTTYDDLMAWHNEQLGEKCALLTIREQLEPKIDILFSGINKLPVGIYNLIPIKKDK